MSKQPEALRLADALADRRDWYEFDPSAWCPQAAAELRRLYDIHGKANALCRIRAERIKELEAINAELVEALRGTVEELLSVVNDLNHERMPHDGDEFHERLERARAALANSKVNLEGKAK